MLLDELLRGCRCCPCRQSHVGRAVDQPSANGREGSVRLQAPLDTGEPRTRTSPAAVAAGGVLPRPREAHEPRSSWLLGPRGTRGRPRCKMGWRCLRHRAQARAAFESGPAEPKLAARTRAGIWFI